MDLRQQRQQPINPNQTMQVLEKMGMDLIGPLPKSKQGHVYGLVMQDYFTKWPKAIPLKDTVEMKRRSVFIVIGENK